MFTFLMIFWFSIAFGSDTRTIEHSYPASGVSTISVSGHTGRIRLIGQSTDTVTLRLELKEKKGNVDLNGIELIANTGSRQLNLRLRVPFDKDKLDEFWEITAPKNIAVELEMDVGEIDAENLSGGMNLDVGVGKIRANAPAGNLHAKAGVGDVHAQSQTDSYGIISLDSNVGDVYLTLGDHKVIYPKPAGAGNSFKLQGPGRDEIDLRAGVGDVHLHLDQ